MVFKHSKGAILLKFDATDPKFARSDAMEAFISATGARITQAQIVIDALINAGQRWYCWVP